MAPILKQYLMSGFHCPGTYQTSHIILNADWYNKLKAVPFFHLKKDIRCQELLIEMTHLRVHRYVQLLSRISKPPYDDDHNSKLPFRN